MRKLFRCFSLFCICMVLSTVTALAATPEIYKDSVTLKTGASVDIAFTYGTTASTAELTQSSLSCTVTKIGTTLKVTGQKEGTCYITLVFNDGTVDKVKVTVTDSSSSTYYTDNDFIIALEEGDTKKVYIDLDEYDADEAEVSKSNSKVTLNETDFDSNGYLKITGKSDGESEVIIEYDSGYTEVYTVFVFDEDVADYETFYLSKGEYDSYDVDLDDYDSSYAKFSYDDDEVYVSEDKVTDDESVRFKPLDYGTTDITVKYSSGDIVMLYIYCYGDDDDYYYYTNSEEKGITVENMYLDEGDTDTFYISLGSASYASFSYDDDDLELSKDKVYYNTTITVEALEYGTHTITVKYSDGSKDYIEVLVQDEDFEYSEASISDTDVVLDSGSVYLDLETGTDSDKIYVTIDPEFLELGVSDYSTSKTKYTINTDEETTTTLTLTGKELTDSTDIYVEFDDGKTYTFTVRVIDGTQVVLNGVSSTGDNFVLNTGIDVNSSVLSSGYISGYTDNTFKPNQSITKEEFGVMLSRLIISQNEITDEDYILDVTNSWSKEGIAELASCGIIGNTVYYPSNEITRYEVATMLYNMLDLNDYSNVCNLSDIGYGSTLATIVSKCYNAGIVSGYTDGTFGGNNSITRAEAVSMINRVFYSGSDLSRGCKFTDVDSAYWYYGAVVTAATN